MQLNSTIFTVGRYLIRYLVVIVLAITLVVVTGLEGAFFSVARADDHDTCADRDAIRASNDLAMSFFRNPSTFEQSRVLKKHSPSKLKEVVSYIESDQKRYSIFTLVSVDCAARFMKRTRQND